MTVEELISKLKNYDPEQNVFVYDEHAYMQKLVVVYEMNDGVVITYD